MQPRVGCQSMKLPLATFTDGLVVLYHSFLSDDDSKLYKSRLDTIYTRRKVTEESKKAIKKHQTFLKNKKKNLTKDGKARKERICEKLFHTKTKIKLQVSLYSAALMNHFRRTGVK